MRLPFFVLATSSALALSGCGAVKTASTPPNAASQNAASQNAASQNAARAVVEALSGGAGGARSNARALKSVSDARLAARDYPGAMEARWKMLSVHSKNTSMLGALTSYAIQAMALSGLEPIASHLDSAACRAYAARLRAFDAQSPTYAALLLLKKQEDLDQLQTLWSQPQQWQRVINEFRFTPEERETLRKLSQSQLEQNLNSVYKMALAHARQPYSSQRLKVATDPYTKMFSTPSKRQEFVVTRYQTERLLVIAALQNRADRLEKRGPSSALPADPFGRGPLKSKGDLIYSVGPDTRDDGGRAVPNPNQVHSEDQGDVTAPIF